MIPSTANLTVSVSDLDYAAHLPPPLAILRAAPFSWKHLEILSALVKRLYNRAEICGFVHFLGGIKGF